MNHIPERGDILWVNLNPSKGHEQKGHRPVLVLSGKTFNEKTNLLTVCPITSTNHSYVFHIELKNLKTKGYVMSDQIRTIDWENRKIKYIEKIDKKTYSKVVDILITLISN